MTFSIPYIPRPAGFCDASPLCFFRLSDAGSVVGCAGGETGSDRATWGWRGSREWSAQTLWEVAPFQILFHDIAFQKTPRLTQLAFPLLTHSICSKCKNMSSCGARAFHNRLIQINTTPHRELTNSLPVNLLLLQWPSSVLSPTQQNVQRQSALQSSVAESQRPPATPKTPSAAFLFGMSHHRERHSNICLLWTHGEQFD